ncbi:acyltransferase family protein [Sutcliffiella horikoshii]|uniref:acyltransferase family protein n=1 Tax=Sutcliffiella horikoshii TaxID=79883 RepID=UPI001CFE8571|nr:acyltransferase family protein [Sutcliffiella horikoshii]
MKKQIHEIYWIRAVACLTVVMIHSLTRTYATYELPDTTVDYIRSIQIVLLYATPMFILISEIVIAKVYPDKLPRSFYKKRFLYLFLPYVLTPFLYGLFHLFVENDSWRIVQQGILDKLLLGAWHGYFIIIILQFVFIHYLFIRFLKKISPWLILSVTFIINVVYLAIANLRSDLLPQLMQDQLSFVRMPFLAWIFYFAVAFYVGKYMEDVKGNRRWGFPMAIGATAVTGFLLYKIFTSGVFTQLSSVRLDIMFYTISLFFVIFYFFSFFPTVPNAVMFISKYSFQIFLLHFLVFDIADLFVPEIDIRAYAIIMFIGGVFGSVLLAKIIHLLPIGKYIVGPIKSMPKVKREQG